jgi:tetratricopeptide (TPR) repeat protein
VNRESDDEARGAATSALERGHHQMALLIFSDLLRRDPEHWYHWYGVGEAHSYLKQFDAAIAHLRRAAELKPTKPTIFLALGIAQQLAGDSQAAVSTIGRALELDEDFVLAYNSLAVTQLELGEFDKSLHNFDAGTKAIARAFVRRMQNRRDNPIIPHPTATDHARWMQCAMFGALYHVSAVAPADGIGWPTGESAIEEERTGHHGGLFYSDTQDGNGDITRVFLPNYFNTFHASLHRSLYGKLVGSQGIVLERLGRSEEAAECFAESAAFGLPITKR